jgi:hypothetical protein
VAAILMIQIISVTSGTLLKAAPAVEFMLAPSVSCADSDDDTPDATLLQLSDDP